MFKIFVTLLLFLFSFGILFFNEDKTIRQKLSLDEATSNILTLKWFEPHQVNAYGRVVHLAGPLATGEPLTEPDYNIQVQAVKLRRRVAMYQWVEESVERIGSNPHPQDVMDHDERQYFYALEWREKLIDSSIFYLRSGHQNPPNFPIEAKTQIAEHVTIGSYELSTDIKNWFDDFVLITSDTRPDIPGVKMHSGFYYYSDDVHEPKLGDLRIQFLLAGLEGTSYTVVGLLNESGVIGPFRSKLGQNLLIIKSGEQSLEDVLTQEKFAMAIKSWLLRVLGTALLFMALSKFMEIIAEQRFKGSIKNLTLLRSFRLSSVRLAFALATATFLIALVWTLHRPVIGLSLLVGSAILYVLSLKIVQP